MQFFKLLFGASNLKAGLSALIAVAIFILAKFGYQLNADDSNAILIVGTFVVSFFVTDGSVGNWKSTLTGVITALLYLVGRIGFHVSPDVQSTIITIAGFVVGWLAKPPQTIPKDGTTIWPRAA